MTRSRGDSDLLRMIRENIPNLPQECEAGVLKLCRGREEVVRLLTYMKLAWGLSEEEVSAMEGKPLPPTFIARVAEISKVSFIHDYHLQQLQEAHDSEMQRCRAGHVYRMPGATPPYKQGPVASENAWIVTADELNKLTKDKP